MPKVATSVRLVETATKWRAMCASSFACARNQERAERALASVSWVVKVLEATTKRVVSGESPFRVSARWVASTLETKCARRSGRP